MLDVKLLREDMVCVLNALKKRHFNFDHNAFAALENERKVLQNKLQQLQNQRNTQSKKIGELKAKGQSADALIRQVAALGAELENVKQQTDRVQTQLNDILTHLPNMPHESVPIGCDENDNQQISIWGEQPQFDFAPKDHVDLAGDGIRFDIAAKISAARFSVMVGKLAKIHRALTQFMLAIHTEEHGYEEVYVPYLVNAQSVFATGQLPKFEADLFKTSLSAEHKQRAFYLIPTAEVPVTNMISDTILQAEQLPLKYVAHTPCFRSEAGAYGKDTRGLIRQHQFEKVELVQVVKAEDSYKALEELTAHAESILKRLELPYRKMLLSGGDLGFSAAKTYDLEVWMPGQHAYREISSCSNFEAFQARRMKARWKNPRTHQTQWVHTLNGSGLAVGRTLAALLENHQQADGSIAIPDALRPYVNGSTLIKL